MYKSDFATEPAQGVAGMVQQLSEQLAGGIAQTGISRADVQGVGVGIPGFLNDTCEVVVEAVNLGWHDVPLVAELNAALGLPVAAENDANVAALGESWRGAGQGKSILLCVTVGTGIGGGIVLNGRLHRGRNGMAGEIGHMVVERRHGVQCNCGNHGCLETVASATAIIRTARERLAPLGLAEQIQGAADVFRLAHTGVTTARDVILEAADWLGYGLALVSVALNPDGIVIGGGVSESPDFLDPVRRAFARYSLPLVREAAEVTTAQLGNEAGVVGAARLIQQKLS